MIKIYPDGAWVLEGSSIVPDGEGAGAELAKRGLSLSRDQGRRGTIAHGILEAHNGGDGKNLALTFDALASHDITCVSIIQTARASGMDRFPLPYVLTNCHNSLCAVGGTINADDHAFALSAAKKYGGIYVPPYLAVIHSYMREMMAGCGKMILGSDSHTRYGALGTMAVGEGGGELVKQLLGKTYDFPSPPVVAVCLSGAPRAGVGPHDVALAIIGAVFKNGFVKNKVMEFLGDGVGNLSVDYRNGIDVMTTETACWSSIWKTDEKVRKYLEVRGRGGDYRELEPADAAYYDGLIRVDLDAVEPCIALPFHPANVHTIREFRANAKDILAGTEKECLKTVGGSGPEMNLVKKIHGGSLHVDQGIIAGCSGGSFENITAAASILDGKSTGADGFSLSVYPESQPTLLELARNGAAAKLMEAGVVMREAFCGPCFGAGDVPANGDFSVRHTTRNFPNREGSKPDEGQIAWVALMDARSIAATAANGGRLTAADEIGFSPGGAKFFFNRNVYEKRVYGGRPGTAGGADKGASRETELVFGPNIKDWPSFSPLLSHLLVRIASFITDPVTTTDELIPSGETSSYRSNPPRLAEFTLSRRDPGYVQRAKDIRRLGEDLRDGKTDGETELILSTIKAVPGYETIEKDRITLGSAIYARKPGDGSAREQAASCQRVLGGRANLALEYATKRYRSNLINWGILPFIVDDENAFHPGDYVFFPGIRESLLGGEKTVKGFVHGEGKPLEIAAHLGELTPDERNILADGCLINYYAKDRTG
ncbi:MAG: hydratase [Treponema sp.]|jgi:aconitate hydratase|nr:hydratase [Treponema sp.]